MEKIKELEKLCLNGRYTNKGDILNVLKSKYFKLIIDELEFEIIKPKFTMAFKKEKVNSYELLLVHLDIFIRYIKNNFWFDSYDMILFLDLCLQSDYMKLFLLTKESFHDNNSYKFEEFFWKTIDDINLQNYKILYNQLNLKKQFNKLKFNPNEINLNKKEDSYKTFKFICGVFNCNKSNNLNMFYNLLNINYKKTSFYCEMWNIYLDKYIEKKELYENLF